MCSSLWGTDQKMAHTVSETASTMDLLRGWRLLMSADRHRTRELRVEAQRCFRLAQSTVGLGLAAELLPTKTLVIFTGLMHKVSRTKTGLMHKVSRTKAAAAAEVLFRYMVAR